MRSIRELTIDQRKFLTKLKGRLEWVYTDLGYEMIYQFHLLRELEFINVILVRNEYSIYEDSDKLNSLRSLWGYTKNIDQHV